MLVDIVVKIMQVSDDMDPCDTIRWSCCSKKMYEIWNSLSTDWRLSKRGKWTRFFVKHREDIIWSVFCNNRVLPWQLYRLGFFQQKRILKYVMEMETSGIDRYKLSRICSVGNPSVELLEANLDKLSSLGINYNLSSMKYPLNIVLKYIETYKPYNYHSLFFRKDITIVIWEKYKNENSSLGYSYVIPLEYYVAHESECSITALLDNESIPDTFFYENPQFVKVVSHNYKRSKEFYQRFPTLWEGFERKLNRPIKFWRKQNFEKLNLDLLARNQNLPKEFIIENITKFNDFQLDDFCEHAPLTVEEIEYCNSRLYPRKLNEDILQENDSLPFGYSKNIMILSEHPDITIEWIEANISKRSDYYHDENPWENITYNNFGLTDLCPS
jgi:hypothetical protein